MPTIHQPISPTNPRSSKHRLHKIDATYLYFSKKVDPIISPCVANFLFKQPQDIINALRSYFDHVKNGTSCDFFDDIECYNPKKNQKIYFTYNFGPVISKIIDMVAASQPCDVVEFISIQLQSTEFVNLFGGVINNNYGQEHESTVSTTRNKLNGAITLANSIKNPSPKKPIATSVPLKPADAPPISSVPSKVVSAISSPAPTARIEVKNIQMTLLGMGGGGKTSIINALQGRFDFKTKPSLGFKPTTMMLGPNINVKFYDLGGGPKIRSIWSEYYHDVHAIIYVFDASLTGNSLEESVALFRSTMEHSSLSEKPLLILANKQDKEGALSAIKLSELLNLQNGKNQKYSFAECSSFTGKNIYFPSGDVVANGALSPRGGPSPDDAAVDPRFESALEKFLDDIQTNFVVLNKIVSDDIETRKTEEVKKRLERERKVLRNKIALAFKEQIEPSLLPENLPTANPEDAFTETEGIEFLAGEIGTTAADLDLTAVEIIKLIGYQRLGMQIIGALNSPISKKKVPMTWVEIKALILELRGELGLPITAFLPSKQ